MLTKTRSQEEQEQHEAETLSAKRRNSMTTDFDVEPSDEEIRLAYKIYTEASQQRSPHPESDVQWARVILRRRKNWEHMRYENPLRGSMEQLQLKLRNNIESAASTRPGLVHQPFPLLTISALPNMSPRMSSFSLPTPVKEESEGDVMSLGFAENSPGQSVFGLPESLEHPDVESENPSLPAVVPPTVPSVRGARSSGVVQVSTTGTAIAPLRSNRRTRLRNTIRKISCFGHFPPPQPQTQPESTRPMADVISSEESPIRRQSRSSGEIQGVPTSEEPFLRVGNEISALVGGMISPSIQIQFHARTEDLFPTRGG